MYIPFFCDTNINRDNMLCIYQDIAKLEQEKESLAEQVEEEKQDLLEKLWNANEKNGMLFTELRKLEDLINELSNTHSRICQKGNK